MWGPFEGNNNVHNTSRVPLLKMCVTRWVENINSWEKFSTAHSSLIKMCEVILYGDPDHLLYNDNWPAEVKKNALAFLKGLESSEFIHCMVTLSRSLLYLEMLWLEFRGLVRILYQVLVAS